MAAKVYPASPVSEPQPASDSTYSPRLRAGMNTVREMALIFVSMPILANICPSAEQVAASPGKRSLVQGRGSEKPFGYPASVNNFLALSIFVGKTDCLDRAPKKPSTIS